MSDHSIIPRSIFCCVTGLLAIACAMPATPVFAGNLSLNIADMVAPSFAARGVKALLPQDGSVQLTVGELRVAQQVWRSIRVRCAEFTLTSERVACGRGKLDGIPDLQLDFSFGFDSKHLELGFSGAGESWQVSGDFRDKTWHATAKLHNAQGKRLAKLLPAAWPVFSHGKLDGKLEVAGSSAGLGRVGADLRLAGLAFTDASGLHAAEKLAGKMQLDATRTGARWDWRGAIDWQEGELFWQPLYLHGGYTLQASGQLQGDRLLLARAEGRLAAAGKVELSAQLDIGRKALLEAALHGSDFDLAQLFSDFARPLLGEGILAAMALSGRADVDWKFREGATQDLAVKLHDVDLVDGQKRFLLKGVNADIPWHAAAPAQAAVSFSAGKVWNVAVGASAFKVDMDGLEFGVPVATLPVFDGSFELRDLKLRKQGEEWQWDFSGMLAPISMQQFSKALGWNEMHGVLAATIPKISYRDKLLKVDGKLQFFVFAGLVEADQIRLFDPFGRVPRLSGNVNMRGLDLDLLTRTFSFGNMQGRVDVDVNGLELDNWLPVRFDARLASSPGSYRKKISQKAVENISSLGGAGGAAALQRSFMRIFEMSLAIFVTHAKTPENAITSRGPSTVTWDWKAPEKLSRMTVSHPFPKPSGVIADFAIIRDAAARRRESTFMTGRAHRRPGAARRSRRASVRSC
jgi:hypothetical protein